MACTCGSKGAGTVCTCGGMKSAATPARRYCYPECANLANDWCADCWRDAAPDPSAARRRGPGLAERASGNISPPQPGGSVMTLGELQQKIAEAGWDSGLPLELQDD